MTLSNRKILRTLFRLLAGILYAVCLSACDAKEPLPENRDAEIESPVIANDLSNQKVTAIAEDTQGHIWIGTFRGLNKNNVHDYHQYFCTDDSLGLPDNQITHLLRDSKNRFWVGTVNGVCLYTDKDNFRIIPIEADNKNVRQILEDRNGRIFLNTGFDTLTKAGIIDGNALWVQAGKFVGTSSIALLITVLTALVLLGYRRGEKGSALEKQIGRASCRERVSSPV